MVLIAPHSQARVAGDVENGPESWSFLRAMHFKNISRSWTAPQICGSWCSPHISSGASIPNAPCAGMVLIAPHSQARVAGDVGIEPTLAVLETAVLPLN